MPRFEPVLTRNYGVANSRSLAVYRERGGYVALAKALGMSPDAVAAEVKKADLRGRGGAGFPAGVKWGFLPPKREITYLCVNCDEAEPPTFKDRTLVENDPHQLIEGVLITGYATHTTTAFVYMRAEFHRQFHILQKAIDGDLPVLGICLGLQLMCKYSEEGDTKCLGIFDTSVKRFPTGARVPHMGWNNLEIKDNPLFSGGGKERYVYFVHSYHAAEVPGQNIIATSEYGYAFTAAVQKGNIFGTQFHPEKSGDIGIEMIRNFGGMGA
jgi:imidazole glycerol phosphate synthase glutamine amidotransferase subunit